MKSIFLRSVSLLIVLCNLEVNANLKDGGKRKSSYCFINVTLKQQKRAFGIFSKNTDIYFKLRITHGKQKTFDYKHEKTQDFHGDNVYGVLLKEELKHNDKVELEWWDKDSWSRDDLVGKTVFNYDGSIYGEIPGKNGRKTVEDSWGYSWIACELVEVKDTEHVANTKGWKISTIPDENPTKSFRPIPTKPQQKVKKTDQKEIKCGYKNEYINKVVNDAAVGTNLFDWRDKKRFIDSAIVFGQTAKPSAYPWVVALLHVQTKEHFCGGTIIDSQTILTSKECTKKHKKFIIGVGISKRDAPISDDPKISYKKDGFQKSGEEKGKDRFGAALLDFNEKTGFTIPHPEADLVLLKLQNPIKYPKNSDVGKTKGAKKDKLTFGTFVRPVCLNKKNTDKIWKDFKQIYPIPLTPWTKEAQMQSGLGNNRGATDYYFTGYNNGNGDGHNSLQYNYIGFMPESEKCDVEIVSRKRRSPNKNRRTQTPPSSPKITKKELWKKNQTHILRWKLPHAQNPS